ncbi:hypothetical protein [Olleya namhaensis]|uniref:hypothetical protein n=1 Tax=Olleya namhaensis TaxID=1144750 RepID=UPI0023301875|nr:hypothetical protein [Olleya namhaensis]
MSSFLLENYVLIYRSAEILAAVAGLVLYKKFKSKAVRLFIWFLVYVQFIEIVGAYPLFLAKTKQFSWLKTIIKNTIFDRNFWFFQVFWTVLSTAIIALYFILVNKNNGIKKGLKILLISFLILSTIILIVDYNALHTNSIFSLEILSLIVILSVTICYFIQLLDSEQILKFYKSLSFYIAIGVFFFWLVTTPLYFFEQYFNANDYAYVHIKNYVYLFSIVFMYLSFAMGFIVSTSEKEIEK